MNAITKAKPVESQEGGQVVSLDAGTLMGAIARAASDPNTDVDKFERLMKLYRDIEATNAERAYNAAMTATQEGIGVVGTNKQNTQTKSKYATYDALDRAVRPIYTRHGFSLSYDTGAAEKADDVRVICHVAHIGGHSRDHHVDMPADGKGAKGGDVMTRTHAAGSAFSYGQRYLLKLIFNIATGEEDDDGNAASARDRSAGFTAAMTALNNCGSLAEVKDWKSKNGATIQTLPTTEADELIRLANQRATKLREAVQ